MLLSPDFCLKLCRRWIADGIRFHPRDSAGNLARGRNQGVWAKAGRGFTLLELLVVIGLVASLCAIAVGLGRRAIEAGHIARAQTELAALSAALEEYRRVCGDYPRTGAGAEFLQALIGRRGPVGETIALHGFVESGKFSMENAADPFLDSDAVLVDPWGRPYVYSYKTESPWNNPGYVLYSIGPDGRDSAALLNGGFSNRDPVENADNLDANQPR